MYLSQKANGKFIDWLTASGHQCILLKPSNSLPVGINSHPDLLMCKMGSSADSPIYFGDESILGAKYPKDTIYNGACTGKYFIHLLSATHPDLLQLSRSLGMKEIHVRQGYSKCNLVIVDENSMITGDPGIYQAMIRESSADCLLVSPGNVVLEGYPVGFLGGASGRVGESILFHGDLSAHPDAGKIIPFILSKGLRPVWFEDFPLTDIGSIIEGEYSVFPNGTKGGEK